MSKVTLRPLRADDLEELVRITAATGFFRPDEVEVAREVLTEAASDGERSGYSAFVAADGQRPLGYACFGPAPLTRGTWDIYWVAVDPAYQRRGIGSRLIGRVEQEIGRKGSRLIVVETSSQDMYQPTREFYGALGYKEVSRIADFYDDGDDKITFAKLQRAGGSRTMTP